MGEVTLIYENGTQATFEHVSLVEVEPAKYVVTYLDDDQSDAPIKHEVLLEEVADIEVTGLDDGQYIDRRGVI